MKKRRTRMIWLVAMAAALFAVGAVNALASVQVSYTVRKDYAANTAASWLHTATLGGGEDDSGNGAHFYGDMSGRMAGSLNGDLDNDGVLSNISGVVSGKLKQLSGYLPGPDTYAMSQVFDLKLGLSAGADKSGSFKFISNGDGDFVGGWVDFSLQVSDVELMSGKFFFKPQAEIDSPALSPNRGDDASFTLWGLNWTHDSLPATTGDTLPDYLAFLNLLGQPNSVDRPARGTLGIALYAVRDFDTSTDYHGNPEPTAMIIWGMLAMVGVGCRWRNS